MRRPWMWLLALTAACGGATVTVTLTQENNSGEDGTAKLKDLGNNLTQVVITVATGTDTGLQAAHIHPGSCVQVGPPKFALEPLDGGSSTSTVASKLSDLEGGQYVINVHNSINPATYESCGAIP